MLDTLRRVVTGHNAVGRSVIEIDGPPANTVLRDQGSGVDDTADGRPGSPVAPRAARRIAFRRLILPGSQQSAFARRDTVRNRRPNRPRETHGQRHGGCDARPLRC